MSKKNLFFICVISFTYLLTISAYSNSAPTFWRGWPSSSILAVEKTSGLTIDETNPIEVISEALVFNLKNMTDTWQGKGGTISASYEMRNPTKDNISVQMGFFFISSLEKFDDTKILIRNNYEKVDFEPYFSYAVQDAEYLNLPDILDNIHRVKGYENGDKQSDYESLDRPFILIYTIDFPGESTQNITVSYEATPESKREDTLDWQYTYTYLLSPAQYWDDFGKLNISIYTPKEAPYIVKSNIDFTSEQENIYIAEIDGLPNDDLTFTLYSKPKITFFDHFLAKMLNFLPVFLFIVVLFGWIPVSIIIIAFTLIHAKKKKI